MLQWKPKKYQTAAIKAAIITTVILLAVFWFAGATAVRAQGIEDPSSSLQTGVTIIGQPLGLTSTDIRVVVANIIRVALGILGIVLVVLVLYAGYLWMTAGGNEDQISTAKQFMVNAAIGLAIILSAYAIVSFVISKLVGATTGTSTLNPENLAAPASQNFQGSGALGQIIKDHYPTRDQTQVPRNTRIVITFRRPVKVDSFVDDTTGDGIFGNCRTTVENWYNDCDHVKNFNDNLINIKRFDNNEKIFGAVALAASSTENGVSGVYTIVIKPITDPSSASGGYLGSPTELISYAVHLGSGLLIDDPANGNPSVFAARILGNNYYEWKFTNSSALDTAPPVVSNVFPAEGAVESKNTILQVNFSEPIDPTGIQGKFNSTAESYYVLDGQNIFLKSDNSLLPPGSFNLTNGYRTLEFAPAKECGKNACGQKIYCLPVCDKAGANCNQDNYKVLLRAAKTISAGSFDAQPFSGIADLSGNALDGNKNNTPNTAPTSLPVFPNQEQPDNYFWNFKISDQIDASSPFVQTILPGQDASNVVRDQELSLIFSKRMRADSMYSINIEEKPTQEVPIWKVPFSVFDNSNKTYTRLNHGPFLDASRQYYYPILDSNIQDLHFNCFYPGKGPNRPVDPGTMVSPDCTDTNPQNCCQVITTQNQSFCCNGIVGTKIADTATCLNYLKTNSL
ncbi:MAG TPA: Ig-like domain-containing protein [Candidatus Udaeobacter sp.]|nr:Ig-like domain-containing protein [Candidatus Udaeobacter sp.]